MNPFKKKKADKYDHDAVPPPPPRPEMPKELWVGDKISSIYMPHGARHVSEVGACKLVGGPGYKVTVGHYILVETLEVEKSEVCDIKRVEP